MTGGRCKRRRVNDEDRCLDMEIRKLKEIVGALDCDSHRLQGKISILERIPWNEVRLNRDRSSRIMWKYVKIFQHGFKTRHCEQAKEQELFLRSICQEDMALCGYEWIVHGVDKYIQIFQGYCSCHLNFTMLVHNIHVISNDDDTGDIICEMKCTIFQRITRNLIKSYVPKILNDEQLVQSLIGRDIKIDSNLTFGFNGCGFINLFAGLMLWEQGFAQLIGIEHASTIVRDQEYLKVIRNGISRYKKSLQHDE